MSLKGTPYDRSSAMRIFTQLGVAAYAAFERWVEATHPDVFSEWEAEASEFLDLHEWLDYAHPYVLQAWREYSMARTQIEKLRREIDYIVRPTLRKAVELTLERAPQPVYSWASSSSGKHHPSQDNTADGSLFHVRKVVWMVRQMLAPFHADQLYYDILTAAAIIHDCTQRGIHHITGKTDPEHGWTAAMLFDEAAKEVGLPGHIRTLVGELVEFHSGPWSKPEAWPEPLGVHLSTAVLGRIILHLADYIVSREQVSIELPEME